MMLHPCSLPPLNGTCSQICRVRVVCCAFAFVQLRSNLAPPSESHTSHHIPLLTSLAFVTAPPSYMSIHDPSSPHRDQYDRDHHRTMRFDRHCCDRCHRDFAIGTARATALQYGMCAMPSAYTLLSLAGEFLTSPTTPREASLRSSWEPCRAAPNHRSPRCHRNVGTTEKCRPPRPNPVPMSNPDARPRCVPCRPRCHTTPSDPAIGSRHRIPPSDPTVGPCCP